MTNPVRHQTHDVHLESDSNGNLTLTSNTSLEGVVETSSAWLKKWADETPESVFIAERSGEGWRTLTYKETLESVQALAGGLLERGIGAGDRILVASGNGVDHGLLALATQYIGAAVIPLAEQYSLISEAHPRLLHAAEVTEPKMIYAVDGDRFGDALALFEGYEILVSKGGNFPKFDELLKAGNSGVEEANNRVEADSVAKILMTSGSTSAPKAVPTTHRMMCTNQKQLSDAMPFLTEKPPVIVDWLPWNHVFGGSHNFNMMLANGGTLYIDDGKPTEEHFGRTLENLKMHTGTLVFNVPLGFSMLYKALSNDESLAKRFFSELDLVFYAGASLPQDVWQGFENLALKHRGELPLMTSSWGLTETAPATLMQQEPIRQSGVIGVPLNGVSVKLLPLDDGRFEARVKGENVFKGYLGDPKQTEDAFDDEGFFITGDAMTFVEEDCPNAGLRFAGRISEEFKLLSGTWVRSGALRLELLGELAGLATDLVITGADRNEIGVLIFAAAGVTADDIEKVLIARASRNQASSTHVARAILLKEPPSFSEGEITAKGNLNFKRILARRNSEVECLYEGGEGVIEIGRHS